MQNSRMKESILNLNLVKAGWGKFFKFDISKGKLDWAKWIRIVYAVDDINYEDTILALTGFAYTFRIVNGHFTKNYD